MPKTIPTGSLVAGIEMQMFFLPSFTLVFKHGLKKTVFFLQILLQAVILIVLCYFLVSDNNPISNGS